MMAPGSRGHRHAQPPGPIVSVFQVNRRCLSQLHCGIGNERIVRPLLHCKAQTIRDQSARAALLL
jgi:hypothetical protein